MSGLRLAFISFVRRPVSSLLAALSLVIPIAAAGLMATLIENSREGFRRYDTTLDAIIGGKTPDLQLLMASLYGIGHEENIIPFELLRHAREPMSRKRWTLPGAPGGDADDVVKQATPIIDFAVFGRYRVVGTDETFLQRPEPHANPPSMARGAWLDGPGLAVLGSQVARSENLAPGDEIAARSRLTHPVSGDPLWEKVLTVSGVLAPTGAAYDRMVYTTIEEAFELHRAAIPLNLMRQVRNETGLSYMLIWLHDGQEERLRDFFDNYTVAKTILVREQLEWLERLIGGGRLLGATLVAIIAGLGMLCVMTLFNARFEAMGEDLAILRALGHGKSLVASWLLWEAILVWVAALLPAALLERILSGLIAGSHESIMLHAPLVWPTAHHPMIWGLTLVACPLALVVPLLRLYRHNVHDALKGM